MALPKDGCPLLVCWGFSPTHKIPQTTVHQSLTEELTTCFALPCQRKSSRGDDGTLVETSNVWSVFLSLYKLNRSANVTSMWTLQIYIETLVCRWKDGWMDGWGVPTTRHFKRKGLCVNSVKIDSIRTQEPMGPEVRKVFFPPATIKQSKNFNLTGVTSFASVCFVCRAVVNTFSACSFQIWPPAPLDLYTVPSALSAIKEDCSAQRHLLN